MDKKQPIEKDQIFLTPLASRLRFHYLRGRGHLFSYLKNRYQWHAYPRRGIVASFPLHVDVEISSMCDMRCPMCYTATEQYKARVKRTLMEFDLFRKIIDEAAEHNLFSIRLSLRGEPSLNPCLLDMLRYAKEKGIKEVSMLTNGLKLNEELFEKLAVAGLDWLTVSVDGWGKTYESIRHPARFDDLYRKIKNYSAVKRALKSAKPVVKIQAVWPAIKDDPAHFYEIFRPFVDEVAVNPLIDFLREDTEIEYNRDFVCPYIWQRMSVGADGNILMCQCDEMEEHLLGNAWRDSLGAVWRGAELESIRLIHAAREGFTRLKPCAHCAYPRRKEACRDIFLEERKVKMEKYSGRNDRIGCAR